MQLRYTTEEVRELVAEGACLSYAAPTVRDVDEATDILEGVEELIAKLPEGERFAELKEVALQTGHALWVPVAHNCRLSAGVGRLASAGRAHLRVVGRAGEILLVPEDAPPERVAEAAEHSRRAGIGRTRGSDACLTSSPPCSSLPGRSRWRRFSEASAARRTRMF